MCLEFAVPGLQMFLLLIGRRPLWPIPTEINDSECDRDFSYAIMLVLDAQSTSQEYDYQATREQSAQNVVVFLLA